MRKLLIISILAASAAVIGKAQVNYRDYPNPEFARMIDENPAIACLNACPYELAVQPGADTKAPRGYRPVYISHYGRHGTRSGWDQDKYELIIKTLNQAKEAGILTASGDSLLQETELVKEATGKMDGRLTIRGQREHRAIAGRMYKRFPRVFRRGSRNIRVLTSEVPRCIISMASFTNELSAINPKLHIVMDCGSEIQKEVSNGAAPETRDARRRISDSLWHAVQPDTVALMNTLFTDTDAAGKIVSDIKRLSQAIFSVGRISRSFDYDFNVFRHLDFGTVYAWSDYNNVYMYTGQCNSIEFGESRMKQCEPLADNIVRFADEALESGKISADLRFGHDYPLMALCSYFGVEGIGERYDTDGARKHFISTLYSPFAGNLQMIFYRSRKAGSPVLVKFLLNENEVSIKGLEPVQGPYYSWEAFKEKISR